MHAVVEIVVVTIAGGAGGIAMLAAFVVHRARRAVRLVPKRRTPAPVLWVVHPGRPAQLHRRLRRACRGVSAVVGTPGRSVHPSLRGRPGSPLARVGAELIDRAADVDARLVAAARLTGGWRRSVVHQLAGEVRAIEAAAQRVGRLDAVWRDHLRDQTSLAAGPPDLETRLDAMEATLADLAAPGTGGAT